MLDSPCGECHKRSENGDELKNLVKTAIKDSEIRMAAESCEDF